MRTIRVVSSQTNEVVKLQTSVTSFKELKALLISEKLYKEGMRVIDMNSKVTLDHDDILLPVSNFDIALTPTKSKAGADLTDAEIKKLISDVSNAIYTFFDARGERAEAKELINKATKLFEGLR